MEKMEKKNLNNHTMNEAIAILKEASMKSEKRSNFTIKCDNCTLDIVCGGEFNICDEVIEVTLFTVNGETWHPLNMDNADGSVFTEDRPIIHNLPLICFPAFVRQFKKISDDDMPTVWDAWDTISCFPM